MPRSLVHGAGHARWLPGAALAAVILTVMSACSDRLPTTPPPLDPAFVISDGAHDGNAHFFFLPPLVSQPSVSGMEDGSLSPTVDACDIGTAAPVTDAPCLGAPVASFSTTSGTASELIRYSASGKKYSVNWHTDLSSPALQTGHYYRVSVRVAGTRLGFLDVVPLTNGAQLKNYRTGDIIALVNGRTLPIAFRIEQGAVAPIGAAGGTAVLGDGAVKLVFPADAVAGVIGVTATPVPVNGDGTDTSILPGTRYEFQPSPTTFATPVSLTLTYPAALPPHIHADRLAVCKMVDGACRPIAGSRVDPATRTVTAEITSFSEYSITEWPEIARGIDNGWGQPTSLQLSTAAGEVVLLPGIAGGPNGPLGIMVDLQWEADGSRAVYIMSDDGGYSSAMRVMNWDGTGSATLVGTGEIASGFVKLSPVGKILFTTFTSLGNGAGFYNLMVIDISGANERRLALIRSEPAWSPDGQKVVFMKDSTTVPTLHILNADGTGLHELLVNAFAFEMAWSLDGSQIAFSGQIGQDDGIYIVNADGANPHRIVALSNYFGDQARHIAWSPTGEGLLVYESYDGENNLSSIHTVRSDGSDNRLIAQTSGWPAWSPDGRRIAFIGMVDCKVWLVNLDGTGLQALDDFVVDWCGKFYWRP